MKGVRPPSRVTASNPSKPRIVDFGSPLTHTEILLPLEAKHILSPNPLMAVSKL